MTYSYHAVVDSPHFPRSGDATAPHQLLVTLLGNYWHDYPQQVPSSGLVALLGEFEISPAATRAALSRLSRKGTLTATKSGRRTFYSLSLEATLDIPASQQLTMAFGLVERAWDGSWTAIVFSIPESERDLRHVLRSRLRWLGFGPVRDGVWISPHADIELTKSTISSFLPDKALIFRASEMLGDIDPLKVWDLRELENLYQEFIDEFRPWVYRAAAGEVSQKDALLVTTNALSKWRNFPTIDPDLPSQIAPNSPVRREARRVFGNVYDACGELAAQRIRRIVTPYDASAAARVEHHPSLRWLEETAVVPPKPARQHDETHRNAP